MLSLGTGDGPLIPWASPSDARQRSLAWLTGIRRHVRTVPGNVELERVRCTREKMCEHMDVITDAPPPGIPAGQGSTTLWDESIGDSDREGAGEIVLVSSARSLWPKTSIK